MATNTEPSAHVSAAINPKATNLEQHFEKANSAVTTTIEQRLLSLEQNTVRGTETETKKSRSFKLAFTGIAASLFVFQLDATCLGIALPVSLDNISCLSILSGQSLKIHLRPFLVTCTARAWSHFGQV
jgi:hypothetical protein